MKCSLLVELSVGRTDEEKKKWHNINDDEEVGAVNKHIKVLTIVHMY